MLGADPLTAAALAAARLASLLNSAIEQRGQASVALSGGTSPAPMLQALALEHVPWPDVHVFQVDERFAPHDDAGRNWRLIVDTLVGPTAAHGHAFTVGLGLDKYAASLLRGSDAARLEAVTGSPAVLDVVHLGLGTDGHTASWPPGSDVLQSQETIAVVDNFNNYDRLTLTPPVVNAARHILWFVPGEAKRPMLQRLLDGDRSIPAGHVMTHKAELFTDVTGLNPT